jgi:hypothetical protein
MDSGNRQVKTEEAAHLIRSAFVISRFPLAYFVD